MLPMSRLISAALGPSATSAPQIDPAEVPATRLLGAAAVTDQPVLLERGQRARIGCAQDAAALEGQVLHDFHRHARNWQSSQSRVLIRRPSGERCS
jgi:hypothetical protein